MCLCARVFARYILQRLVEARLVEARLVEARLRAMFCRAYLPHLKMGARKTTHAKRLAARWFNVLQRADVALLQQLFSKEQVTSSLCLSNM
jgi:hypothetical protein